MTKIGQVVYLAIAEDGQYKIGRSLRLEVRRKELIRLKGHLVRFLHTIESDDAEWLENTLHFRFRARRLAGEWYALEEPDVAYFRSLTRVDKPAGAIAPRRSDPIETAVVAFRAYPSVRDAIMRRADAAGKTASELVHDIVCSALGLGPVGYPFPVVSQRKARAAARRKLPSPNGEAPLARPQRKRGEV